MAHRNHANHSRLIRPEEPRDKLFFELYASRSRKWTPETCRRRRWVILAGADVGICDADFRSYRLGGRPDRSRLRVDAGIVWQHCWRYYKVAGRSNQSYVRGQAWSKMATLSSKIGRRDCGECCRSPSAPGCAGCRLFVSSWNRLVFVASYRRSPGTGCNRFRSVGSILIPPGILQTAPVTGSIYPSSGAEDPALPAESVRFLRLQTRSVIREHPGLWARFQMMR